MPMSGFWFGVANLVVKRPALILIVCIAALSPLAVIGGGRSRITANSPI